MPLTPRAQAISQESKGIFRLKDITISDKKISRD